MLINSHNSFDQEFAHRRNIRDEQQALAEGLRRTTLASQHQRQTQQQQSPSPQPAQQSPVTQQPPSQPTLPSLVSVTSTTSTSLTPQNRAATSVELPFNSADPFMASTDFHTRQESADSGLGLGSNYTHPHTPEDFLNAMDDVDITQSDGKLFFIFIFSGSFLIFSVERISSFIFYIKCVVVKILLMICKKAFISFFF